MSEEETIQEELDNDEAPGIVHDILEEAVRERYSDIYFVPQEDGLVVKVRKKGTQKEIQRIEPETANHCITHIKVLCGMLTYRNNIAQDGVIRSGEVDTEMRVASIPTIHGERISIRMINYVERPVYLDDLNFRKPITDRIKEILKHPSGLFIFTGPSGSGKTTSIYAVLRELLKNNQDPASIITLEDPVESSIAGISQCQIKTDGTEWNYELALKAALRQDVKTLVVGEMRDPRVVKMVLDASLTGHRVISTYHAGDIPSVFARLLHQGFEPFLVAAAVTGVVSQRLVPGTDGDLVPVVAAMQPDHKWRDFLCHHPDLATLKEKIHSDPLADLNIQADLVQEEGRITKEQAALLKI